MNKNSDNSSENFFNRENRNKTPRKSDLLTDEMKKKLKKENKINSQFVLMKTKENFNDQKDKNLEIVKSYHKDPIRPSDENTNKHLANQSKKNEKATEKEPVTKKTNPPIKKYIDIRDAVKESEIYVARTDPNFVILKDTRQSRNSTYDKLNKK